VTVTSRLKVRRHGSARTHYADIPDTLTQAATILGRDCRTVTPPVAALCGVVLGARGPDAIVVMRDTVDVGCRACVKIANLLPAVSRG
jgi:hypothetical protein